VRSYSPEKRLDQNVFEKFRSTSTAIKNSPSVDSRKNAYFKQDTHPFTLMRISRAVKHDYVPKQLKMITFRGRKHKLRGRNAVLTSALMTQDCNTPTTATVEDPNY
jgi:hypothetical protein